ncbi:hypothetical protein V8G54_003289, partial [Vigna mungo]
MGMITAPKYTNFLLLLFFLFCFIASFSHASNSLTPDKEIRDNNNGADNLVSEDLSFEMGFFGFDSSSRYVGIWYHNFSSSATAFIWVANREKPIMGRGGSIKIKGDGNLVVFDGENNEVWSTNKSISTNNTKAVLGNDGNLVLSEESEHEKKVWQSFENPTDTFVPGMSLPINAGMSLFRSWKSATDPSPGNYSMGVDSGGSTIQILILDGEKRRWRTGYWDGRVFTGVSNMTGSSLFGFKLNENRFTYTWNETEKVRFQITWDGFEKKFISNEEETQWNNTQHEPYNKCEHYNFCGNFAVCDISKTSVCSCLHGFQQGELSEWDDGNSGGCKRRTPLQAERNSSGTEVNVGEDGFFVQSCTKLPDFARLESPSNDEECRRFCLQNSSCTAYSYTIGIGCMIWYVDLVDVQHTENDIGSVLNIRLADSELVASEGEKKSKTWIIIIITVVVGLICLGISVLLVWRFKRKRE